MDKAILYIHGKGGNPKEAEYYKALFEEYDVIGFDYSRELSNRLTLFIDNASFEKERLLHCVIAMRRVTRYTVYSVRGKE